jgi:hypothetical protein
LRILAICPRSAMFLSNALFLRLRSCSISHRCRNMCISPHRLVTCISLRPRCAMSSLLARFTTINHQQSGSSNQPKSLFLFLSLPVVENLHCRILSPSGPKYTTRTSQKPANSWNSEVHSPVALAFVFEFHWFYFPYFTEVSYVDSAVGLQIVSFDLNYS